MNFVKLKWQRLVFLLIVLIAPLANAQSIIPAADGTGTIVTPSGSSYDIDGGSLSGDGANLFHSFQELGLNPGEIANFLSNPAVQNIFGRVVGGNASVIDGLIQVTGSNANLFLMNPAGIVFGANASLNLPADFTATTATGIGFEGGWFNVSGTPNYSALVGSPNQFAFATPQPGSIINAGHLTLAPEQNLMLLGGTVVNTGTLDTAGGNITVAAIPGEKRVRISQTGMVLNLEVEALNAQPGGETPLAFTPESLPDLLTGGNLQNATGVSLNPDGTVQLTGSNIPLPAQSGNALISGTIDVSAPQNGASGGTVNLLGDRIALVGAAIDASGADGGGTVLVGGDYQGQGTVPNAKNVFVSNDSVINVDALNSGDGGRAIVWADEVTRFFGTITARGGAQSGNGGFVETSGKQILETLGAFVDTSAANGQAGDWLLDPHNITIDNVVASSGGVFSGGSPDVFTAIADNAVVDVDDIIAALAVNRSVTIFTGATGTQEGDITIATPIVIPDTFGIATLELIAADDIFVNSDVTYADNNTGHAFNIVFSAGGDINAANRTISTSQPSPAGGSLRTGSISLTAGGDITVGTVSAATTSNFGGDITGGAISFTAGGDIRADTINTSASTSISPGGNGNAIAGAISLTANGSITTQTIAASAAAKQVGGVVDARGGAVAVSAGSSLSAGTINSSAFANQLVVGGATATGGTVQLSSGTAPGNNLNFTSINTSATAINGVTNTGTGGAATIAARGGTVQGTGTGTTILTSGTTAGGTVTIEHDGGPNNLPFVIGDASQNGLAGSIDRGSSSLSSGSFPVLPNGGSVIPASGITITSNNEAPTLSSNSNFTLSGLQLGQSLSFSLIDLLSASDVNSDVLSFAIGAILNGTLTRNGVVLSAGDTIAAGDVLVYTPVDSVSGTIDAFTIRATDGVSVSSFQTVRFEVGAQQAATIAPQQGERQPEALQLLEEEQPCLDASATVVDLEKHFTRQFEKYFARSRNTPVKNIPIKTAKAIRSTLQQAEQQTGEKPALLYAAFVCRDSLTMTTAPRSFTKSLLPSQSFTKSLPQTLAKSKTSQTHKLDSSSASSSLPGADDRLALWLVTDREGAVQPVLTGVTRREVREVAQSFLQAVTNPATLNRQNYLEPAQQLYEWLVAPVEVSLQTKGIETLAFVMDGGLRSLPLAALHDGEAFVVERYSVGLMPSMSLSDTRYARLEAGQVMAMGAAEFHPSQNQIPLPGVEVELDAIARQQPLNQIFFNQDFIFANLQKALANRSTQILHLATHADFRSGHPRDSYIQLWDSRLSLEFLPQLNLSQSPAVELLILSACRTAVGDPNAELGFAGLAVQAGVKTALGSLWYVSDEGTMGLMTSFYRSLNQTSIKADALQQAQIAMLKGKVRLESGELVTRAGPFPLPDAIAQYGNRNLSHPYYWSAFTLVGSPW